MLLTLLILVITLQVGFATINVKVSDNSITIIGNNPTEATMSAMLLGNSYNINDINRGTISQVVYGSGQMKIIDINNINLPILMDDNTASGDYKARIRLSTETQPFEIPFYYASLHDRQTALAAIKQSNLSTIDGILSLYRKTLQIDKELSNAPYTELYHKNIVLGSLTGKTYTDVAHFLSDFKKSVDTQWTAEQQEREAVQAINDVSEWKMEATLKTYSAVLGIDLSGTYSTLTNGHKAEVLRTLALDYTFTSAQNIKTVFEAKVSELKAIEVASSSLGIAGGSGPSGGGGGSPRIITGTTPTPVPTPEITPELTTFNDLISVPWAKESIDGLANKGIVSGMGDGSFKPNDIVTRAQFIKMLVKTFNLEDQNAQSDFTDVKQDMWYYQYISSAQKKGIAQGMDDGTFGVDKELTRQEMVVLSFRTLSCANVKLPVVVQSEDYIDNEQIESYAIQAIEVMQQADIVRGVDGNRFAPEEKASRAMASKVIYGLLKYVN